MCHIPSYFNPEKISVTVPCELKYHDVKYGQRPTKTAKTSWINYVFEEAQGKKCTNLHRSEISFYRPSRNAMADIPQVQHYSKTNSWAAPSSAPSQPRRPCASTKVSLAHSPMPSKCVAWRICVFGKTTRPPP